MKNLTTKGGDNKMGKTTIKKVDTEEVKPEATETAEEAGKVEETTEVVADEAKTEAVEETKTEEVATNEAKADEAKTEEVKTEEVAEVKTEEVKPEGEAEAAVTTEATAEVATETEAATEKAEKADTSKKPAKPDDGANGGKGDDADDNEQDDTDNDPEDKNEGKEKGGKKKKKAASEKSDEAIDLLKATLALTTDEVVKENLTKALSAMGVEIEEPTEEAKKIAELENKLEKQAGEIAELKELVKKASTEGATDEKPKDAVEETGKEEVAEDKTEEAEKAETAEVKKAGTSSEGASTQILKLLNDLKNRVEKVELQPAPSKAVVFSKMFGPAENNEEELVKINSRLDEIAKVRDASPEVYHQDIPLQTEALTLIAKKKSLQGVV